jgi:hypothetical protein
MRGRGSPPSCMKARDNDSKADGARIRKVDGGACFAELEPLLALLERSAQHLRRTVPAHGVQSHDRFGERKRASEIDGCTGQGGQADSALLEDMEFGQRSDPHPNLAAATPCATNAADTRFGRNRKQRQVERNRGRLVSRHTFRERHQLRPETQAVSQSRVGFSALELAGTDQHTPAKPHQRSLAKQPADARRCGLQQARNIDGRHHVRTPDAPHDRRCRRTAFGASRRPQAADLRVVASQDLRHAVAATSNAKISCGGRGRRVADEAQPKKTSTSS